MIDLGFERLADRFEARIECYALAEQEAGLPACLPASIDAR